MIDLHCHVLPGIDDGASNMRDALRLCAIAERENITSIICTPHFADYSDVDEFSEKCRLLQENLADALEREKIELDVKLGCELYLDSEIYSAPSLDKVTLNGSRYMLCEFSLGRFDYEEALGWIDELIKRGYTPIIAHPERYSVFQRTPELINEFSKKPVLFQINADSLAGEGSKSSFNLACELIMRNLVDFISSDAHSPRSRPNNLLSKSEYFPDFIDNDTLETLLEKNPERVLKNLTVHPLAREII